MISWVRSSEFKIENLKFIYHTCGLFFTGCIHNQREGYSNYVMLDCQTFSWNDLSCKMRLENLVLISFYRWSSSCRRIEWKEGWERSFGVGNGRDCWWGIWSGKVCGGDFKRSALPIWRIGRMAVLWAVGEWDSINFTSILGYRWWWWWWYGFCLLCICIIGFISVGLSVCVLLYSTKCFSLANYGISDLQQLLGVRTV